MPDTTRHDELAQLYFSHVMSVIEANDKRYVNCFSANAEAVTLAREEAQRSFDSLRSTYINGHLDVVKKIDELQSVADSSKGTFKGIAHFAGWGLAALSLILGVGLHLADIQEDDIKHHDTTESEQAKVNTGLIQRNYEVMEKLQKDVAEIKERASK